MDVQPGNRPAPGEPVVVQYFKFPGDVHWRHDMVYLGQDEHGVWLGGPAGTTIQRGLEPAKQWPYPFVQLIPTDRWWSLHFNGSYSRNFRVYVDVAQPAEWVAPGRVEMVDFDLDVVRRHDGSVEVLDEDEFLYHIDRYSYPDWLVDRVRTTAAELVLAVETGTEPFGVAGEPWLALVEGG
jgi:protein associated with RNAse G/E